MSDADRKAARSAAYAAWAAAIVTLLLGVGNMAYQFVGDRRQSVEAVKCFVSRVDDDYKTELNSRGQFRSGLYVTVSVYWKVIFANQSAFDAVVVDYDLKNVSSLHRETYELMAQGLYDRTLKRMDLPFTVPKGGEKTILVKVGLILNGEASGRLEEAYGYDPYSAEGPFVIESVHEAHRRVTEKGIDFFGNKVARGFFEEPEVQDRRFLASFQTARGSQVIILLKWYGDERGVLGKQ